MKTLRVCVATVATLFMTTAVDASPVLIDPDAFPVGTDISEMFDGVTLARLVNGPLGPLEEAIYAAAPNRPSSELSIGGSSFYTWHYESCRIGRSCGVFRLLELVFDSPTNYVRVDSLGGEDPPGLLAYDSQGNLLGESWWNHSNLISWTELAPGTFSSIIEIRREQADIARVVYGGIYGSQSPMEIIFHVPEPSSLLLMSVGALAFARRRRRPQMRPCLDVSVARHERAFGSR